MKRIMALVVACVLLATMLAGCGHKHNYRTSADIVNHFQLCDECGRKDKSQEHTLDEQGVCSECGAVVDAWEDGSGTICRYDEKGNMIENVFYEQDGSVRNSQRWEYVYDGENVASCTLYRDGVRWSESIYQLRTQPLEGEEAVYCQKTIFYEKDRVRAHSEYDEQGTLTASVSYDAEGNPYYTETYTYEYDEEGRNTKRSVFVNGKLSEENHFAMGENEEMYDQMMILYDENGKVIRLEEYDSNGNIIRAEGELSEETSEETEAESETTG